MIPDPSALLFAGFVGLPILMAAVFLVAARRVRGNVIGLTVMLVAWLGLSAGLAAGGHLAHFDPPRPLPLFLAGIAGVVVLARSPLGTRLAALPLGWLVGFQAFRIAVELLIHRAAMEGIAPKEMSWDGYNLDIVTGLTALALAPLADRLPRAALHAWNLLGLGLLLTVVGTAVVAMPTPFQQLATRPPNVWIAHFPFVWLPTVLVLVALTGHALLYRALFSHEPSASAQEQEQPGDEEQPAAAAA